MNTKLNQKKVTTGEADGEREDKGPMGRRSRMDGCKQAQKA